jgi:hypothetical protein
VVEVAVSKVDALRPAAPRVGYVLEASPMATAGYSPVKSTTGAVGAFVFTESMLFFAADFDVLSRTSR